MNLKSKCVIKKIDNRILLSGYIKKIINKYCRDVTLKSWLLITQIIDNAVVLCRLILPLNFNISQAFLRHTYKNVCFKAHMQEVFFFNVHKQMVNFNATQCLLYITKVTKLIFKSITK